MITLRKPLEINYVVKKNSRVNEYKKLIKKVRVHYYERVIKGLGCRSIKGYKRLKMHDYRRVIKGLGCMTIKGCKRVSVRH